MYLLQNVFASKRIPPTPLHPSSDDDDGDDDDDDDDVSKRIASERICFRHVDGRFRKILEGRSRESPWTRGLVKF